MLNYQKTEIKENSKKCLRSLYSIQEAIKRKKMQPFGLVIIQNRTFYKLKMLMWQLNTGNELKTQI